MRRARFFASLTCILPRRFRRNGELKLPRIFGFLATRGVWLTGRLVGFGKTAEMGFGEGLRPADGPETVLTSYTPLGRTGVGDRVDCCVSKDGPCSVPYLYLSIRRKTNIVRR